MGRDRTGAGGGEKGRWTTDKQTLAEERPISQAVSIPVGQ